MSSNVLQENIKCFYCGMTIISPPIYYGFPPICNENDCDYRASIKSIKDIDI